MEETEKDREGEDQEEEEGYDDEEEDDRVTTSELTLAFQKVVENRR